MSHQKESRVLHATGPPTEETWELFLKNYLPKGWKGKALSFGFHYPLVKGGHKAFTSLKLRAERVWGLNGFLLKWEVHTRAQGEVLWDYTCTKPIKSLHKDGQNTHRIDHPRSSWGKMWEQVDLFMPAAKLCHKVPLMVVACCILCKDWMQEAILNKLLSPLLPLVLNL